MKKSKILLTLSLFITPLLTSCDDSNTLLVLNWGEYINEDTVLAFEEETGISVKISTADSNELFYSKVKSKTTAYDLVLPSDYMVEKMIKNDLISKLDFSKLPNYDPNNFLPGVNGIINDMSEEFKEYQVPYFWGTFGIMYNKKVQGLEDIVKEQGLDTLFKTDILPSNTKVGMYNVPRFAYSFALSYLNEDINVEDDKNIEKAYNVLKNAEYYEWGTDQLKKDIQNGNLDLAMVYTGDFLDMLYEDIKNDIEVSGNPKGVHEYNYDLYIPENTIAFMDSFVMPNNARHEDNAYKFINYYLKTENAFKNASSIGYCTPIKSTYNKIIDGINDKDVFNRRFAEAIRTYYPIIDSEKGYLGTPLKNISREFLTKIINMVNNVKA